MSDTETTGDTLSNDVDFSIEKQLVSKLEGRLVSLEVITRHGASNHEVKRRYEFQPIAVDQ